MADEATMGGARVSALRQQAPAAWTLVLAATLWRALRGRGRTGPRRLVHSSTPRGAVPRPAEGPPWRRRPGTISAWDLP